MDVEDFAALLGVHFHQIEAWEEGRPLESPLEAALFHVIEAHPRECVDVLRHASKERAQLRERIFAAIRQHGHGPKHTIALKRLRDLVGVVRTRVGLEQRAEPDEITQALLELEEHRFIRLEASAQPDLLEPLERQAGIHDPKRGLLSYAAPGPRMPRG